MRYFLIFIFVFCFSSANVFAEDGLVFPSKDVESNFYRFEYKISEIDKKYIKLENEVRDELENLKLKEEKIDDIAGTGFITRSKCF